MKLRLKLMTLLLGSALTLGASACSLGGFNISGNGGGTASSSEQGGSQESSSTSQKGSTVDGHTIYIDGDYDEDDPSILGGQMLDLSCLIDGQKSNKVAWSSSANAIATVDAGEVQFKNVTEEKKVTITATSTEFDELEFGIEFTVKPCAINLANSYPEDLEITNEDGTAFSVPKKKSALIFNGTPASTFYAEATFTVSDRDDALTRIGLITSEDDEGQSLNGTDAAFFYYIYIDANSQNKSSSRDIGIATTNSSKNAWSTIRHTTAASTVYTKGIACTLGLLRHGTEYYVFSVKNGVKTNLTHYVFSGISTNSPSYVWLGTSFGESGTGDNGKIAYTANNFTYLTGAQAEAIYQQYKVEDGTCTHSTVCNNLCLECGELLAPLNPYNANGYAAHYNTLAMDAGKQFSVTYGVHWEAADNGGYAHGWAADIDTLNWSDGGWSVRPDWWGWGAWNPATGNNNEGVAGTHQNIFSATEMTNVDATVTIKYVKTTGVDDDGDYAGHIEIDCSYTSNVGQKRTMTVHYASRDFNVMQSWKCIYIDFGGETSTVTVKSIKINYGLTKGNGQDNFRVWN